LLPSADIATEVQCSLGTTLFDVQVFPEFVEVQIRPPSATAANVFPSAEEATQIQSSKGTLFVIQVFPESVEV
jgi:hypothetical protein